MSFGDRFDGHFCSEVSDREAYVVAAIEQWNRGLPSVAARVKYEKLVETALTFFCGTNHLFWADFRGDVRLERFGSSQTKTWIVGDCHVASFSASGSDTEGPTYGVSEFDESFIADYQYDLWRMAISIMLVASANLPADSALEKAQRSAISAFVRGYLKALEGFRYKTGDLTRQPAREKLTSLLTYIGSNMRGRLVWFLGHVERECSHKKFLKKWCRMESSKLDFKWPNESLQTCPQMESDAVAAAFGYYTETTRGPGLENTGFNVKRIARRVFDGTGACSLARYVVLAESMDGEPHVLDVKLQQRPTGYHFLPPLERTQYHRTFPHEALRFMEACRHLSPSQDPYAGWVEIKRDVHLLLAGYYSVRELSPYQESYPILADPDGRQKLKPFLLNSEDSLAELAEDWGRILGNQHTLAACALQVEPLTDQRPRFADEILRLAGVEAALAFEEQVHIVAQTYARQVLLDREAFHHYLRADAGVLPAH